MTEVQTFLIGTASFIVGLSLIVYVAIGAVETFILRKIKKEGLYHGIVRRMVLKKLGGKNEG